MVGILGGGIAGLAAAYELGKNGREYALFEKDSEVGGLLKNFTIEGFRFDQAIHLSFADEKEVRDIFDQTPYLAHKPESTCFETDLYLRHPVQNNLYPLSVGEKITLIESFCERQNLNPNNYDEWLVHQYGEAIADRYPRKYTVKYWDCDASHLGLDWIGNRMHRPNLEQILEGAFSDKIPNYYYAKEMRYPKKGGYISFLDPIVRDVSVNLNHELYCIDLDAKQLKFSNGNSYHYQQLINTIPLPTLIERALKVPDEIKEAARRLEWTKVIIVSFGFDKKVNINSLWSYIYDEDIYASRIYSPSWKSGENCPKGTSSVQFEIYQSSKRTSPRFDKIIENCRYAIKKMDIATVEDVVVEDLRVLPYGNVVFYNGVEQDREKVIKYLESKSVQCAGRFGAWEYYWSNQAFMSGLSAARKLVDL
ncbi:MAG: protoporphyrinogen/coproporphyrinogen oxidase [Neptuniibacter sp.]